MCVCNIWFAKIIQLWEGLDFPNGDETKVWRIELGSSSGEVESSDPRHGTGFHVCLFLTIFKHTLTYLDSFQASCKVSSSRF